MSFDGKREGSIFRHLCVVAAGLASLAIIGVGAASAGECPPDKQGVTKPGPTESKDVTDKVLSSIDLGKDKVAVTDHRLRLRKLEVKPGGVVAWHSHGDRPAIIYIIKGEIVEYASNCAVPIVHKAGQVASETSGTAHWWKNMGQQPVVLLSADILQGESDHNM